ncbi:MAG TPA: FixG Ig-like domain-containing protein, partial [Rhodopila sp.]|nr:FixG Ig-like domain-containing protein [Rhodopila sp.]
TYMCPWPRFQSAMLDEQSLTVTYQRWRGEPRGHGKRDPAHTGAKRLGDCVDCGACIHACPTGIDIRDGIQLECINCGLCVDACNEIMAKTGQPKYLITWDTLARQSAKASGTFEKLRLFRPRTVIYGSVMAIAILAMVTALVLRPTQELFVQHDRAPVFVQEPSGAVRNGYVIAISNKTLQDAAFVLHADGMPGAGLRLTDSGQPAASELTLKVPADSVGEFRVLVSTPTPEAGGHPVDFVVHNTLNHDRSVYRSVFIGPGGTGS